MTTPALLVAFLRPTKKPPPPWAPDGSCIIMKGTDGWTLGPKKRTPSDPLLLAATKHAYDLGKTTEIGFVIKDWKESMPRGRGIAWDVWAWQVKTRTWVKP